MPLPMAASVPGLATLGDPAVDAGFDPDASAGTGASETVDGDADAEADAGAAAEDWPWSWPTASFKKDEFRRGARFGAGVGLPAIFWKAMAIGERLRLRD